MSKTNENKDNKRTYKMPETTILEHLLAKAGKGGYCKSGGFLEKVLKVKVVQTKYRFGADFRIQKR